MRNLIISVTVLTMAAGSMAVVAGPYPVDADTLHLYHFDVEADGVIRDMVPTNKLDLTFANGAALAASTAGFGRALNTYDGIANPSGGTMAPYASDGLNLVAISTLTGSNGEFTFEALVRPDMAPGAEPGQMEIICGDNDSGSNTDRGFQFRINDGGTTLRFQTISGSTLSFDAPITYTAGQWYHAAVTYDGNAGVAGNLKLYWTPVGSATSATQVGGPFTMTADLDAVDTTRLCIGNELRNVNGFGNENFEGLIDEVRISRIARAPGSMMFGNSVPWAQNPVPAAGQTNVDSLTLATFQWDTGQAANVTKFYLYMRKDDPNFVDVAPITATDLTDPITEFVPEPLQGGSVYYWRVDESISNSGPTDAATVQGPVWSFRTAFLIPQFTGNPTDQFVFPAGAAVFSVTLLNEAGVSYRWYKGEFPLSDGSGVSGSATSTLTIGNAQMDHEGVYFCRATNFEGSTDSSSAILQIKRLTSHYPLETDVRDEVSAFDMILMQEGTAGLPALTANAVHASVGTYSLQFSNADHAADPNGQYAQIGAGVVDYRDITISAWVYWNGGANWQRIFDFGNDTTHYMFLTPSNGSECRFVLNNGGGEQIAGMGAALPANEWVFVAVTLDGNTGRLYVNGEPKATNAGMNINPEDLAPALNYIGKSQFTADPEFDGMIDNMEVYNYAVTAETLASTYFGVTGTHPCYNPEFADSMYNPDNTGSSYCRIDIADLQLVAENWLANGLWQLP